MKYMIPIFCCVASMAFGGVATVRHNGVLNMVADSYSFSGGVLTLPGAGTLTGFGGVLVEFDGPPPQLKSQIPVDVVTLSEGISNVVVDGVTNEIPYTSTNISARIEYRDIDVHTNSLTNCRVVVLDEQLCKTPARKAAENEFFLYEKLILQMAGDARGDLPMNQIPVLATAELRDVLNVIGTTNPLASVKLALDGFGIDKELSLMEPRWWYSAAWHPEVP